MPDLNARALLWGAGLFMLLYLLHILLLPWLVGERVSGSEYQGLLYGINQLLGVSTCLIPGFVSARISGRMGFVHGGVVGAIGTILSALSAMAWSLGTGAKFVGLAMLPFWLLINVFLSAFAGFIANSVEDEANS